MQIRPPIVPHNMHKLEKIAIEKKKLVPENERIAFKNEKFAAKSSLLEAKTPYCLLQCRKLDIELPVYHTMKLGIPSTYESAPGVSNANGIDDKKPKIIETTSCLCTFDLD
uniref:Uncharacterized protein n=1 Tax=Romanomermis culicivorax TaxID=13658 RepID=A0A915JSW4_ROMCU